jgi:hypothetical protein
MENENQPKPLEHVAPREGRKYKDMNGKEKVIFILKLAVCIMTFGMAFPNVMSD